MKVLEHSILPFKLPFNYINDEDLLSARSITGASSRSSSNGSNPQGQRVVVKYLRSYTKRIKVEKVPAFWQHYIEDI